MGIERRALCSLGIGPHSELLDLALPALESFAERFGYELIVRRTSLATERPPAWSKVTLLDQALSDHDLAVWIDADAVLVDGSSDIADDCHSRRSVSMVVHRFAGQEVPNTGVCVLRSDRHAERFLADVWNLDVYTDHPWWDNAAALDVLGFAVRPPVRPIARSAWARRIGELPLRWNSIAACSAPDPAIVHLAGCSHAVRLAAMRKLAMAA